VSAPQQVHDFEPGIADNGLFWTIPIAPGWVDIDPGTGSARFVGRNVPVRDFTDFDNAVSGGSSTPSRVDFVVTWTKAGDPVQLSSPGEEFDFAAEYTPATATISFTARTDTSDVVYTSDPDLSSQTNAVTAVVGTEENGVFHS
jgi:hypothetical protein